MTNAKREFLTHTAERTVRCATVSNVDAGWRHDVTNFALKVGYTKDEYEQFLTTLDYEYDSGYGGQELFGTIWYTDGTWSERGEYDGSEWWEHRKIPDIPDNLK